MKKKYAVLSGFLAVYCVAFQVIAFMINQYGHENAPKGYKFPEYKGLWMSGVGFIFWKILKTIITSLVRLQLAPRLMSKTESPAERNKDASDAGENFYRFIYFTISTYWGWVSLCHSKWLPWYLGGLNQGSVEQALKNFPFIP